MTNANAGGHDSTPDEARKPEPASVAPAAAGLPLRPDAPVPVRKWLVSPLAATTLAVTSGVTFFLVILGSVATPTMGATRSAHLKWKADQEAARESLGQPAGTKGAAHPQPTPQIAPPENESVNHA